MTIGARAAQIVIWQFDYRELTTPCDKPLAPRLYVMDKRPKRKLERDLKRYRALLKLTTDERALAVRKQLISETVDRLNDQ